MFPNKLARQPIIYLYLFSLYEKLILKILFKPKTQQNTSPNAIGQDAHRNAPELKGTERKGVGKGVAKTTVSDEGLGVTCIKRDELH